MADKDVISSPASGSRHGADYYRDVDQRYWSQRQTSRSDRTQELRSRFFRDLGRDDAVVLDFGCGTGGILSRVSAARRLGIELGEDAAREAREKGIEVFPSLAEIPDSSVDVAISFHALEHVDQPLSAMMEIARVLKPGGRARLIVPCEVPVRRNNRGWQPNDDQHLYTWTPLIFGNLAGRAGLREVKTRLAPMQSGSRAARLLGQDSMLGRLWFTYVSLRDNSFNVVLDAEAP